MDKKVREHFRKVDPVLSRALADIGELEAMTTRVPKEYFSALCREIIAQQLNGKVAQIIFERFKNLFPRKKIDSKYLLKLKPEALRKTGMSHSKVKFLLNLAEKVESKIILLEKLKELDNENVINELTKVKGIGRWTAEMFLMFCLGREDIFSYGDLGLANAVRSIYKLENGTRKEIEEIVIKWSPYRSYACRILWRVKDKK